MTELLKSKRANLVALLMLRDERDLHGNSHGVIDGLIAALASEIGMPRRYGLNWRWPDDVAAARRRADRWVTRCLLVATIAVVAWAIHDGDAAEAAIMAFLVGMAAKDALRRS